jgi:hypothetical protein
MMATICDDEIAQRKGVCQVVYNRMSPRFSVSAMISTIIKAGNLYTSLPCRVTSSHQCYEEPQGRVNVISAMRMAFGKELRLRMKAHFGKEGRQAGRRI